MLLGIKYINWWHGVFKFISCTWNDMRHVEILKFIIFWLQLLLRSSFFVMSHFGIIDDVVVVVFVWLSWQNHTSFFLSLFSGWSDSALFNVEWPCYLYALCHENIAKYVLRTYVRTFARNRSFWKVRMSAFFCVYCMKKMAWNKSAARDYFFSSLLAPKKWQISPSTTTPFQPRQQQQQQPPARSVIFPASLFPTNEASSYFTLAVAGQ